MGRALASLQRKRAHKLFRHTQPQAGDINAPVQQAGQQEGQHPAPPQPWPSEQDRSQYTRSASPDSSPVSGQISLLNVPAHPTPTKELLSFPKDKASMLDSLTWLTHSPPHCPLMSLLLVFPAPSLPLVLAHCTDPLFTPCHQRSG